MSLIEDIILHAFYLITLILRITAIHFKINIIHNYYPNVDFSSHFFSTDINTHFDGTKILKPFLLYSYDFKLTSMLWLQ